ncbi:MAG: AMP-binding protein, partial [Pseudomonadota bacterium]
MTQAHDTLPRLAANHTPLSPLSFLKRTATVFPSRPAIVYGNVRRTWAQTYGRCRRLASALSALGLQRGDVVSVMAHNTPELYECHYGVPMAGCVLNALNTRLDAATIAFILNHAEAKLLIADREFAPIVRAALAELGRTLPVIEINDP